MTSPVTQAVPAVASTQAARVAAPVGGVPGANYNAGTQVFPGLAQGTGFIGPQVYSGLAQGTGFIAPAAAPAWVTSG
jgi:hypothetical protein